MQIEYDNVVDARDATLESIAAINELLEDPDASDLDKEYSAVLVDHLIGIVEVSKKYLLLRDAQDQGLTPRQYRVVQEHSVLDAKLGRLTKFLGTDICTALDWKEQEDLEQQRQAMTEYLRILASRIATYKEAHEIGTVPKGVPIE